MTQRFPLAARLWRVLSRALNKPITPKAPATDVTSEIPSAGIQIPEEGANRDYASFYRGTGNIPQFGLRVTRGCRRTWL
ncbi:MAG: hypothetical protein FRX48_07533 [Lasallia pustulata]|uniref:Uncharacterized protein n=1 Tax=Lasallia pustulata TaxID=136370 RepID=A0A5M8PGH1_9LECA|nr:MAG: hypothetical protein FRX48_07533 [Lasallia pustulata]